MESLKENILIELKIWVNWSESRRGHEDDQMLEQLSYED